MHLLVFASCRFHRVLSLFNLIRLHFDCHSFLQHSRACTANLNSTSRPSHGNDKRRAPNGTNIRKVYLHMRRRFQKENRNRHLRTQLHANTQGRNCRSSPRMPERFLAPNAKPKKTQTHMNDTACQSFPPTCLKDCRP
jgi:hypothetical protein